MSRIHDALKKAEQERAMAPAAGLAASMVDPPTVSTQHLGNGAVAIGASVLTHTPVLARPAGKNPDFAELRMRCAHPGWNLRPNANVFSDPAATARGAEQFRTLRSRLYQLRGDQRLQTILVTSAVPSEGKTFVVNNLAQAIVRQSDRSALIIDADLRRPHLHIPLGAPSSPGLTNYLRAEVDETAVIQCGQQGNLCFIPAGDDVTNPSELLMNGRLKVLLDRVAPVFDWIIVDSPPCLLVADASVLADLCDGVLLVVRAASTRAAVAQRARQELHGRRILGVVLNSVESDPSYGSSYYGYANNDK